MSQNVDAQTTASQTMDPHVVDVAGVKLGMTADEAIAALQNFKKNYTIVKHYIAEPTSEVLPTGRSLEDFKRFSGLPLSEKYAILTDIAALDPISDCDSRNYMSGDPCNTQRKLGYGHQDIVHIWLSSEIARERVIAVSRAEYYGDSDPSVIQANDPLISAVKAAISDKYKATPSIVWVGGSTSYVWAFDGKGRIISPERAKQLNLGIEAPRFFKAGDGIRLAVQFGSGSDRSETHVANLDSSLIDGDAVYRASVQRAEIYKSQKTKQDSENSSTSKVAPKL